MPHYQGCDVARHHTDESADPHSSGSLDTDDQPGGDARGAVRRWLGYNKLRPSSSTMPESSFARCNHEQVDGMAS